VTLVVLALLLAIPLAVASAPTTVAMTMVAKPLPSGLAVPAGLNHTIGDSAVLCLGTGAGDDRLALG